MIIPKYFEDNHTFGVLHSDIYRAESGLEVPSGN